MTNINNKLLYWDENSIFSCYTIKQLKTNGYYFMKLVCIVYDNYFFSYLVLTYLYHLHNHRIYRNFEEKTALVDPYNNYFMTHLDEFYAHCKYWGVFPGNETPKTQGLCVIRTKILVISCEILFVNSLSTLSVNNRWLQLRCKILRLMVNHVVTNTYQDRTPKNVLSLSVSLFLCSLGKSHSKSLPTIVLATLTTNIPTVFSPIRISCPQKLSFRTFI